MAKDAQLRKYTHKRLIKNLLLAKENRDICLRKQQSLRSLQGVNLANQAKTLATLSHCKFGKKILEDNIDDATSSESLGTEEF